MRPQMVSVTSHETCPAGQMQLVPAAQSARVAHGCPWLALATQVGGNVVAPQRADSGSQATGSGCNVSGSSRHGCPTCGGFLHVPTVLLVRAQRRGSAQ